MSQDDKTALRRRFRAERTRFVQQLGDHEHSLAFSRIPSPLARLCSEGTVVAGYVAIGTEADPARLLREAEKLGCTIALPHVTSRSAPMRFLLHPMDAPLVEGPHGLLQPPDNAPPVTPDIAIVPLIAFDAKLFRLGQGAGHYDRALSLLDNCMTVGLAWSIQFTQSLPTDPWDIPMDAILTEKSWISR